MDGYVLDDLQAYPGEDFSAVLFRFQGPGAEGAPQVPAFVAELRDWPPRVRLTFHGVRGTELEPTDLAGLSRTLPLVREAVVERPLDDSAVELVLYLSAPALFRAYGGEGGVGLDLKPHHAPPADVFAVRVLSDGPLGPGEPALALAQEVRSAGFPGEVLATTDPRIVAVEAGAYGSEAEALSVSASMERAGFRVRVDRRGSLDLPAPR